jgi:hypothetical protein
MAAGKPVVQRMTAQDKKWQAQDNLRTIQRAAEVTSNAARLKAAQAEAAQQVAALNKVVKPKK